MQRTDTLYIHHMMDTARKIAQRAQGLSQDQFDAQEDLRDAIVHRIQVIGEAASKVSQMLREEHPEVEWQRIIGMRNRIVHDYMNVDYDIVWQVATHSVQKLIVALEPLLTKE